MPFSQMVQVRIKRIIQRGGKLVFNTDHKGLTLNDNVDTLIR